jgi:hypothetical protein
MPVPESGRQGYAGSSTQVCPATVDTDEQKKLKTQNKNSAGPSMPLFAALDRAVAVAVAVPYRINNENSASSRACRSFGANRFQHNAARGYFVPHLHTRPVTEMSGVGSDALSVQQSAELLAAW